MVLPWSLVTNTICCHPFMLKDKDNWFLWRLYNCLRTYSARTELILLLLTYNPLTVFYPLRNS